LSITLLCQSGMRQHKKAQRAENGKRNRAEHIQNSRKTVLTEHLPPVSAIGNFPLHNPLERSGTGIFSTITTIGKVPSHPLERIQHRSGVGFWYPAFR
jgi:hypothetical protein